MGLSGVKGAAALRQSTADTHEPHIKLSVVKGDTWMGQLSTAMRRGHNPTSDAPSLDGDRLGHLRFFRAQKSPYCQDTLFS